MELQKAQSKVDIGTWDYLRSIGGHIKGCDFENSLRMWECYQKGFLQGARTLDELYE